MRDAHLEKLKDVAPYLEPLRERAEATMFYELLSGALVWTDEISGAQDGDFSCAEILRPVFRHRSNLIEGEQLDRYAEHWQEAQRLFPNWPGFLPSRRAPTLKETLLTERTQALRKLDKLFD